MNIPNNHLSKLRMETVEHFIRTNPYDHIKTEEQDLLLLSVKQAISNIDKLTDICNRLGRNSPAGVRKLKSATVELLKIAEAFNPNERVPERRKDTERTATVSVNATKPWSSNHPTSKKRTRRP